MGSEDFIALTNAIVAAQEIARSVNFKKVLKGGRDYFPIGDKFGCYIYKSSRDDFVCRLHMVSNKRTDYSAMHIVPFTLHHFSRALKDGSVENIKCCDCENVFNRNDFYFCPMCGCRTSPSDEVIPHA